MVKLRFKRFGRRNRPYYRLNAQDSRTKRDGRSIEELGTYDPVEKDPAKQVNLKLDRVRYWLSVGAQPSETVAALLKKQGVEVKETKQVQNRKKKKTPPKAPAAAPEAATA